MSDDTLDLPEWDPAPYARFQSERDRAALDLLLRLPDDLAPGEIWDMGCGAGQHAALLKRRYPDAAVHGLDASPAMLEQARLRPEAIDWRVGAIDDWTPQVAPDLILANASLHWLDDHQTLLPRLASSLAPGGILAVQMPMAHETRHHRIVREVAGQGPWADVLADTRPIQPLLDAEAYYALLAPLCDDIDIWATTYLHALTGPDAVLAWLTGAGLRPYLTALDGDPPMRAAFSASLGDALSRAFPMRPDGTTLLPFPRLFLVARRR